MSFRKLCLSIVVPCSVFILDLSSTGPLYSQVCGGDNQKPCIKEGWRTPCGQCSAGWCELTSCTYTKEFCNSKYSVVERGLCRTTSHYDVPRPQPVSFRDGTHLVTSGFQVKIDLAQAWVVIPNTQTSNLCASTPASPNALRTVVPDRNAYWYNSWTNDPYYASLAINGSFFDILAYENNSQIHSVPCTSVYGYTLSNKSLVKQEEKIKVYQHGALPIVVTPATLVFYTEEYSRESGTHAGIKNYPMFEGQPRRIPSNYQNAISGVPLVHNGRYVPSYPMSGECLPRTAVGLTRDGQYLIAVVVNPGSNRPGCIDNTGGTTLQGLANYLISLGAYNAINLDGGGSSQMYYRPSPTLGTRPSDLVPQFNWSPPGTRFYRPVGNFLGFR